MDWQALLAGTHDVVGALIRIMLHGVGVLLGVWFIYSGVSKMLAHSRGERQGQSTAGPVAANFFIGALMLQLSWSIEAISNSMFGESREPISKAMSYMPDPVAQNTMLKQAVEVGVMWVYCIGFAAIIRGFVQWNALASGNSRGQDSGWKGFWHIFFGAMAVNLTAVIKIFTAGGT